jgi:hypothetical protein
MRSRLVKGRCPLEMVLSAARQIAAAVSTLAQVEESDLEHAG